MARAFIARALGAGPCQEAKPKSEGWQLSTAHALQGRPADLVRARLAEARIPEATLIRLLKDRCAIPAGTPGLQRIFSEAPRDPARELGGGRRPTELNPLTLLP
jgi:hypothetical protein